MNIKLRVLSCLLLMLCFLTEATGQTVSVTGRVTRGTTNEPLAGATITVRGASTFATTNENGEYTITVPATGATLVVSYTGMADQEIPVTGTGPYNFSLQERATGTLNEVVVVGYGAQRRGNVTGSIATVTNRELVQSPVADMSNALQGRVAGIITRQGSGAPGSDGSSIFVRGVSTFGGAGTEPLYVVDGIVRDKRDFTQLDPSEIESVSVLKDASSAAIFGVKGANGVVVVTTRRGRAGRITANYSFNYGFQKVTKFNDNLGSYEYATLYNEALLNDGLPLAFTNTQIEAFRSGSDPIQYPNTNWQRLVLGGTAPQMRHNLSFSGGSERVKYFASLGYLDQDGLYESLNFKRYNVRSNLDLQVTKTTRFSMDISGRIENRQSPTTGISGIFEHTLRNPPTIPAEYPGVGYAQVGSYVNTLRAIDPAAGYDRAESNVIITNFQLEQQIPWVKGLSVKGVAAFDRSLNFYKRWSDNVYVYTKNPTTGNFDRSAYQNPSLAETFEQWRSIEFQGQLNYANRFGRHGVSALVLVLQKETQYNRLFASRSGYEFSAFDVLSQGPATNPTGTITEVIQGTRDRYAMRSGAARFNYDFDNKYLFQASLRRDQSENFAPDNRTGYFPAFSVGWVVSSENFMEATHGVLDYFKLRASWGKLGSDAIPGSRLPFLARYAAQGSAYAFGGAIVPGLNPLAVNPLAGWEQSAKTDIGFDARLWKGLLGLEVSFFNEHRTGILAYRTAQIPASYGGPLPAENVGETKNRGVEISLTHDRSLSKDLFYNLKGNVTLVKNEIVYAAEANNVPEAFRVAGRPIGSYYGYKAIGIIRDDETLKSYNKITQYPHGLGDIMYEDVNGDGRIDNADRQWLSSGNVPQVVYGLAGGVNFRGIELNVLFQGATRVYQQLTNNAGFAFFNGGRVTAEWLDRWTPDNPDAAYPRLSTNATASTNNYQIPGGPPFGMGGNSFWIEDASYLRLKNLELAYTFRPAILSKISASQLRVFATGQNLVTFTKLRNVDPENSDSNGWYYPVQAVYNFGLNIQF